MKKHTLSIVIVNWNTNECVYDCLKSIQESNSDYYEMERVIIVDNNSNERINERKFPDGIKVMLIENQKNEGFAKACNQGGKIGESEFILFLNPDTRLYKHTLDGCMNYVNHLEKNKRLGVLGVQIVDENGVIQKTCSRFPKLRYNIVKCFGVNKILKSQNQFMFDWNHSESRVVDEVMGAFFFVPRIVYREIGGFDERYFVYYEEVDFCKQVKERGYYTYYLTSEQVYHEAGAASSQVKAERLFYEWRSRYLYEEKHNGKKAAVRYDCVRNFEVESRKIEKRMKKMQKECLEIERANAMFRDWKKKSKNM